MVIWIKNAREVFLRFFRYRNNFLICSLSFPVPTPAPGEPVYYVTFIITNTYGKDVYLRTSLPSPYNTIIIINGKTVRMSIKVLTQEDITFEAFVRETGEKITINGQDVFTITPRDSAGESTVLRLPELIGMFIVVLIFLGIFWMCSPAAKCTISIGS
jgi:hypothetical protein